MIDTKNLVRHELIGLHCEIEDSTAIQNKGLSGRVVDESRNTLTIEVKKKEKVFVKEECMFMFTIPSGSKVSIEGKLLVGRPEDRIKKKLKRW